MDRYTENKLKETRSKLGKQLMSEDAAYWTKRQLGILFNCAAVTVFGPEGAVKRGPNKNKNKKKCDPKACDKKECQGKKKCPKK